ncbi:MAG TPA: hypothetical protein VL443_02535 [Cyclobacteriaceae bacterium]|jgi:hypothetical protein|nr:hypothetical protein [Cyclobacteriaceae bacterium]
MKTSDTIQFKASSEEKKSFSYYLPVLLSALIVMIVLLELTNHELIDRLIAELFMNKE